MLPPPYPCNTVNQTIDLLQVIWKLQHPEHLDERSDHTSVLQQHRVDEFQPDGVRQREGLTKEAANLSDVNFALSQKR